MEARSNNMRTLLEVAVAADWKTSVFKRNDDWKEQLGATKSEVEVSQKKRSRAPGL